MTKIAVYSIAKNEAKYVNRWYDSVKDADGLFVLDTGSQDNTVDLLEERGITVFSASFFPFRFDSARNLILQQIPKEYDWCLFLDLDEVLDRDWYTRLKSAIETNPKATGFNLYFVFNTCQDGRPNITYYRHMLHRTDSYMWHYPVHELLTFKGDGKNLILNTDVRAYHLPDNTKPRSQYLDLLKLSVAENPDCPRSMQYLAREYMYNESYNNAILLFQEHMKIESNPILRCESMRYIAECFTGLKRPQETERWYFRAIAEAPMHREPWGDMADFYYRCGEFESCLGMIIGMLRITDVPENSVIRKHDYYATWPYHMGAVCYHNLLSTANACLFIREAIALSPNDPYVIADFISITKEIPKSLNLDNLSNITVI